MEAEFLAIVIDDAFTPQDALPCKSQVSTPVNDEIDFRISFDESDDEDYTIISDKNSFSYKMISVNNLKMDSENDNENADIPSFPLPKPTTSYVNDLDFFKDFENEFLAIVYNDAQTSKSDLLIPSVLPGTGVSERMIPRKGDLHDYWRGIFTDGDFLGPSPFYTLIRDLVLRLCHRMMAYSIVRRSQAPEKILRGLTVIAPELSIIDLVAKDAPAVNEGDQAIPAPVHAPQPPPPPPATAQTMP
ncbi:hypothetical protein Tco_1426420 [Tanacetum coccineum]